MPDNETKSDQTELRRTSVDSQLEWRVLELEKRLADADARGRAEAAAALPRPRPAPDASCSDDQCEPRGCCAIEVVFKRARVLSGQVGLDRAADGETTTGVMGSLTGMEVQFYLDVEGSGIIVPNQIWGYMQLSKQANKPGVWHDVDRVARVLYAPCSGKARMASFTLQAVEREVGRTETLVHGKDEFGLVTGRVPISCCGEPVEHHTELTLHGGGDGEGTLEVVLEVRPQR